MDETWFNYTEAAKRVKKSVGTIRRWRREGMVMEWRVGTDGQMGRVVELAELMRAFRQALTDSPVHFYRMRRAAIERGETPPPVPERFRRGRSQKVPGTDRETLSERDSDASQPSGVPEYQVSG